MKPDNPKGCNNDPMHDLGKKHVGELQVCRIKSNEVESKTEEKYWSPLVPTVFQPTH